jgi:hypothetical protein
MTTNVMTMISSRKGNGAPDAVVSGSPKAAARDTIPRMPVQATTNTTGHGGSGSRRRSAGLTARGITAASGTQTSRIAIATALITAP